MNEKNLNRLQPVHNTAAMLFIMTQKREHLFWSHYIGFQFILEFSLTFLSWF